MASNQAAYNGSTPRKPAHTYTQYQAQGATSDAASLREYRLSQFQNGPSATPTEAPSSRGARISQQLYAVDAAFKRRA
ncbi:uncharacterized protein G6M90_00g018050 [Metarhizium brunneum]|uniref:Uncharacterized protein n=1 Tax=Metarhizium brunneum TaxID=500148 RepID=A0A7D5UT47_9HYPO|nr:hypothetical protein G6M90_00g018050 [Metarhizium brunneum]